jgi:hypothetical protein
MHFDMDGAQMTPLEVAEYVVKSVYTRFIRLPLIRDLPWTRKQEPPAKPEARIPEGRESMGCLYYFGDLLDHLDDYFHTLRLLRQCDPDCYDLYRHIGAQVINSDSLLEFGRLKKAWLKQRPAFGMIHMRDFNEEDDDRIPVALAYYDKVSQPFNVERSRHDIYEASFFFSNRLNTKKAFNDKASFHVSVSPRGKITLLKELHQYSVKVGSRKKGSAGTIYRKKFAIPGELKWWVDDIRKRENRKKLTEEKYAAHIFSFIANAMINVNAGIQIAVKRGHLTAVFNIDMLRTPYFFKDREKTVNHNGRTKKIFHIVRTHKRRTRKGEKYIKTHFRGIKEFNWNGYDVRIKSPKRRLHLSSFDLPGTVLEEDKPIPGGFMTRGKTGKLLADEERKSG